MKKCFLPIKMAAPMKKSTLQHNLKICTFNLWENDEKIKWISDLICMKHLVSCLATVILQELWTCIQQLTKKIQSIILHHVRHSCPADHRGSSRPICLLKIWPPPLSIIIVLWLQYRGGQIFRRQIGCDELLCFLMS